VSTEKTLITMEKPRSVTPLPANELLQSIFQFAWSFTVYYAKILTVQTISRLRERLSGLHQKREHSHKVISANCMSIWSYQRQFSAQCVAMVSPQIWTCCCCVEHLIKRDFWVLLLRLSKPPKSGAFPAVILLRRCVRVIALNIIHSLVFFAWTSIFTEPTSERSTCERIKLII
jgi:hypothetical protein